MYLLRNKLIVLVTVANFAFLALGNVLVHRVVGKADCDCLAHQHSLSLDADEHLNCDCSGPVKAEMLVKDDSQDESQSNHPCLLCKFFEQRVQQVSNFELTLHSTLVVEISPTNARILPLDHVQAFPARGPPAVS